MRALLRPLLLPLLRKDVALIERAARGFHIERPAGRRLVQGVGQAFFAGYNGMLEAWQLTDLRARGLALAPHYRPFFFEGAAMGYLPRGYLRDDVSIERAEDDLLRLDPDYRYLYYVGLGFWFGFRHPRRYDRIERLAGHVDPIYFPLCYDGLGFKLGFFDHPRGRALARLRRCPAERAAALYQGFGRAMFFVYMDDPAGFETLRAALPAERRNDLRLGQALATGFTGVDDPARLLGYLAVADDDADLAARLTGLTWALTARRMNDDGYFRQCLAGVDRRSRRMLRELPVLCERELARAQSYDEWQRRTCEAARALYARDGLRLVDGGG